jgi:hypothetical protein
MGGAWVACVHAGGGDRASGQRWLELVMHPSPPLGSIRLRGARYLVVVCMHALVRSRPQGLARVTSCKRCVAIRTSQAGGVSLLLATMTDGVEFKPLEKV